MIFGNRSAAILARLQETEQLFQAAGQKIRYGFGADPEVSPMW
jgi:hypothetical protein